MKLTGSDSSSELDKVGPCEVSSFYSEGHATLNASCSWNFAPNTSGCSRPPVNGQSGNTVRSILWFPCPQMRSRRNGERKTRRSPNFNFKDLESRSLGMGEGRGWPTTQTSEEHSAISHSQRYIKPSSSIWPFRPSPFRISMHFSWWSSLRHKSLPASYSSIPSLQRKAIRNAGVFPRFLY